MRALSSKGELSTYCSRISVRRESTTVTFKARLQHLFGSQLHQNERPPTSLGLSHGITRCPSSSGSLLVRLYEEKIWPIGNVLPQKCQTFHSRH